MLKTALRAWWRHHPVSLALQVAQPLLGQYARDQPFKLLAVSAGVGAAAVVLRPWRVVSLGGMLMAALKPSELSGAMLSLLSSSRPSSAHLKEHHETND